MISTALITGPSSGIGWELARLFARDGYGLVLVSSNSAKLEKAARELKQEFSIPLTVIVKDLSQPEASEELYRQIQREKVSVDALVNNAGFGALGLFYEADLSHALAMMQLNMVTLAHLTRLVLPDMVTRGRGRILNVASTAAFQPGPLMATYYATKAFVLSFSQALSYELAGTGVTVTALCPGPTKTDFGKRAKMGRKFLLSGLMKMEARPVAQAGYRGMLQRKRLVIPGVINKILVFSLRFLPRRFTLFVVNSVQKNMV